MTNDAYPSDVWQRAAKIRLLILDVDGVLTDGSLVYGAKEELFKVFHVRDGHGIKMAQLAGVEVAFLSGRRSDAAFLRAKDLAVTRYFEGLRDKVPVMEELCRTLKLQPEEVAAVGDEHVDLPLFHRVGLAVAVADAVAEVQAHAHWTTRNPGGRGAVREVTDLILKAGGYWDRLMATWLPRNGADAVEDN